MRIKKLQRINLLIFSKATFCQRLSVVISGLVHLCPQSLVSLTADRIPRLRSVVGFLHDGFLFQKRNDQVR